MGFSYIKLVFFGLNKGAQPLNFFIFLVFCKPGICSEDPCCGMEKIIMEMALR